MAALVQLHAPPYRLDEEAVQWVEQTIAGMTDEEKIGQLFFHLFMLNGAPFGSHPYTNKELLEKFHIGGARYQGGSAEQVQDLLNELQTHSRIPLLVAANCDSGGNGACSGGTYIASAAHCEASGDETVAYNAGLISAREETALGVNVNFDPCVDIVTNWRNTIVNTRSYGREADTVIKYSSAYLRGLMAERDVIQCIKHFPGDGTEERDQHLVLGINELTVEEWEKSFGKVYRHHIANGVDMIMAGHIALPHYQKKLNPRLKDAEILPATLSEELIQGLLKSTLDFNGLVITDASHMLGMTSSMQRKDYVPKAIAAGCDMFLFFNDIEEDFTYMMNGYKRGIITEERLHDALRRILGLKAKLRLHIKQKNGTLLKERSALAVIGCKEHLRMQEEAADKGISLIKNTLAQLPIRPETHKRIRLYVLKASNSGGIYAGSDTFTEQAVRILSEKGFEVSVNQSGIREKGSIEAYKREVDAAFIFADIVGYAVVNNVRIEWSAAMSNEIPWYVHEVPTVMVSFNFTNHLHDATMVKCYINAYHDNETCIRKTIEKIMGESPFNGIHFNENVWAGQWQAKL